jgi:hypothetical protein
MYKSLSVYSENQASGSRTWILATSSATEGCYMMVRELGYGIYSWITKIFSVLLRVMLAIKVLTLNATAALKVGYLDEISLLWRLRNTTKMDNSTVSPSMILLCTQPRMASARTIAWSQKPYQWILIRFRRQYPHRVLLLPILKYYTYR